MENFMTSKNSQNTRTVMPYCIRTMIETDISIIVDAFEKHAWPKPHETFELYLKEQIAGTRQCWVIYEDTNFAGYVTLQWESAYLPFREKSIPEIMDLNVLPPFRGKGFGAALLKTAEDAAVARGALTAGLGVGLYADYGAAQRLYVSRGYQPDGLGVTYNYTSVIPGNSTILDDDLILWFTKELKKS